MQDPVDGHFQRVHSECVPKTPFQLPPLHPSMADPFARLLYQTMSALSERVYSAGWISGNEYSLWHILQSGDHEYGGITISEEDIQELYVLSQQVKGWIWVGPAGAYDPQVVSLDRWRLMYEQEMERCKVAIAAMEKASHQR